MRSEAKKKIQTTEKKASVFIPFIFLFGGVFFFYACVYECIERWQQ